jgi:undecaprenyl-diphosphatase
MGPEMSTEETTVLGIVQRLTEFLPLSSSDRLLLFQYLIRLRALEALLDIALLVGTLLAILMLFRADVTLIIIESMGLVTAVLPKEKTIGHVQQSPHEALAFWTLLGMAPTALPRVTLSLFSQEMFASTFLVCLMLIVTGALLWASSLDRDLALKITMGMLRSRKLYYFAPYCFMADIVAIVL